MNARVLRLQPAPDIDYVPCPTWCIHHVDTQDYGRSHSGIERCIATQTSNARQVYVRLRAVLRDDGTEQTDVFLLDVDGKAVELSLMQMREFIRAAEKTFWHQDGNGYLYTRQTSPFKEAP